MKQRGAIARPILTLALATALASPVLAQVSIPAAPPSVQTRPAAAPAAPAAPATQAAASMPAPAVAADAPIQPVDLARYTCQDLMVDMLNKQLDRIHLTVTIAWGLARAKDDPGNTRLDFAQVKPLNEAVWKSCALGDRARHVRDVVADEMKMVRSSS